MIIGQKYVLLLVKIIFIEVESFFCFPQMLFGIFRQKPTMNGFGRKR